MLSALKLPGFKWVAGVYALNYLEDLAAAVALMVLVYSKTDSALAAAAMLTCKQVIPGFTTAALSSLLDRVPLRAAMSITYLVSAAALAILAFAGYGPQLYVLAIIAGISGSAVRALLRTALSSSTKGHDLRNANALLNVEMGIVTLLGPAVGALLTAQFGAQAAIGVTAGSATALALAGVFMPAAVRRSAQSTAATDSADDVATADDDLAATATTATPPVSARSLLILGGLVIGLFSMDEPGLLAYSEHSLHAGVGGYGAFLTAWGGGMIVGSIAYGRVLHRPMWLIFTAGAVIAAGGYVGLGVAPTILAACVVATIGGTGNGVYWVALVTAIQESAKPGQEGKAAGRLEGIATAAPAIGVLVGGLVADQVSPRASLLVPGVLSLLAIAAWLVSQRRTILAAAAPTLAANTASSHRSLAPPGEPALPLQHT